MCLPKVSYYEDINLHFASPYIRFRSLLFIDENFLQNFLLFQAPL